MFRSPPPVSSLHRRSVWLALPLLMLVASCQSADADESSAGATQQTMSPGNPAPAPATPAPAAPAASPGGSDGAAARASTQTGIAPAVASAPDAGIARPSAPASSLAACIAVAATYDDCEIIHVTVTEAERCIQLAIDNCSDYGRMALAAELPVTWRLASASVSDRAEPCELGVFYPDSTIIGGASGEITWDQTTPRPTALEIDVTLEARSVSGIAASYTVETSAPLNPQRCED